MSLRETGMVWENARSVLQSELESNETLLWSGQPRQGVFLQTSDVFLIPFSLAWGGFAVFWEVMALIMVFGVDERPPLAFAIVFPLFGLPFVIIGLYLIFGRFIHDSARRRKTYYGLTDRRIIIVSGIRQRTVQSVSLSGLTELSLSVRRDKSGTIRFGPAHPFSTFAGSGSWPGMSRMRGPCLEAIPNAKEVHDRIREAQAKL